MTHHDAPHSEWPEADTSHNEAKGDEPPATWQPGGKVTNPPEPEPQTPAPSEDPL